MKDDAFHLLDIDKSTLSDFALQSIEIENNIETGRILKRAARRLKDIEDRMQSDGKRPEFSRQSVDEVIKKIKRAITNGRAEWSLAELRIISYHLGRFQNSQSQFNFAIGLLENDWRDLFINGIVFFLMNSWNTCSEQIRDHACRILKKHLREYVGSIKRYHQLKSSMDLFDTSGPARLSALLRAKSMLLEDAPLQLGYKPAALSFPYFSDVIIDYVRKTALPDYGYLEELFAQKHSLDRTKKLVFAHMIEDADNMEDALLQTNVSRIARRVLGDINDSTTWTPFAGASPEEKELLRKAKDLVTAWYARKSVEAFFDICVQDPRRRKCWLEYVQNVSDFRIVGSMATKAKLKSDSNVAPLLGKCFIETNSRVATTAALVLFMKDKVFVEFSDIGSLYIYNSNHPMVRSIKAKKYIETTGDLKATSIGMAVEKVSSWSYDFSDEGRITHQGEWENRFRLWMRAKMEVRAGEKIKQGPYEAADTAATAACHSSRGLSPEGASVKAESRVAAQPSLFKGDEITTPSESGIPHPGSRIRTGISGIQSKWVFNNSVRVIADSKYVCLFVKASGRTYYLCPNPVKKIAKCSIWMVSSHNSEKMFEVKFAVQNEVRADSPTLYSLGKLTWRKPDTVFAPLNSSQIVIHTN